MHALAMLKREDFMMNMELRKTSTQDISSSFTENKTLTLMISLGCFSEEVYSMADYTKEDIINVLNRDKEIINNKNHRMQKVF